MMINQKPRCADPRRAPIITRGPHAQISLRSLQSCPECWGGCTTLTAVGRAPCAEREGWRRVGLHNAAQIPSALSTMTMQRAAMLTGSRLESAWRWLLMAPDLPSMWVKGDAIKRRPRAVLAALCHDLTMARGVSARFVILADLADQLVEHHKSGSDGKGIAHIRGVDVVALCGLDGVMRPRDARALYWLACNRDRTVLFGATRTSKDLSELAGGVLGGDGGAVIRAWMEPARPMGWLS